MPFAGGASIDPECGADSQGTPQSAVRRHSQYEINGPNQVGTLLEQEFAFPQGFAHQTDLSVLEVAKAPMDDPRCPAGGTAREVIFLNQQNTATGKGTLPRDGNTIDAASHNGEVVVLAAQRLASWV